MDFIDVWDSDRQCISVRVDLIESIRHPTGRVHDNGQIVLTTGRVISLGPSESVQRLLRDIRVIREHQEQT